MSNILLELYGENLQKHALKILADKFVFSRFDIPREPQRLVVWHPGQLSKDATLYHRLENEREEQEWDWQ